jgi:hypothetical protein
VECLDQLLKLLDIAAKLAAVIISLCAFVISFVTLRRQVERDRRTIVPFLCLTYINEHDKHFEWVIENGGLGPAKIDSFRVFINGEEKTPSTDGVIFRDALNMPDMTVTEHCWFAGRDALPAGAKQTLLKIHFNKGELAKGKSLGEFGWKIQYSSFAGEPFDYEWPRITNSD